MVLPEEKVKFVVGLSNGESLTEGEGILTKVAGEDSPWWKLQKYIDKNDLEIRSISLYSKTKVGNRHYHLPNDPHKWDKFNRNKQGVESGAVPVSYGFKRGYSGDALGTGNKYEHYTCIEAIYEDFRVQLWVSELDNDKCWINVIEKNNG